MARVPRTGYDRKTTLRRAQETTRTRTPTRVPTRGASPIADRVSGMRKTQAPGQGAIDFGRAMTGQNTGLQQAMDAIRAKVGQGLASKGIYQDQSGYHIRGLPQAPDTGIAMRDAAVAAMGGDPWTRIVQEADARLRAGNLPIPTTAGVNGPLPQPGLGGVPATRTGIPTPTPTATAPTRGVAPQPGLGGVPSLPVAQPRVATPGAVPQPGLGGVPPMAGRPSNVTPFPPQGQGVGRGTTPTGNQVSPGQYPVTAPQPGLGGTMGIPPGGAPTGRVGVSAPPAQTTPTLGSSINANDRIGVSAPTQQSINNGAFQPYSQGYMGPEAAARQQQQAVFNASPGLGGNVFTPKEQQQQPAPTVWERSTPGQISPQTGVPSPGLGGVPQIPGRPATPTVAPGALPGQSTPSRPGQMPSVFPNGKVFGSSGPTTMPTVQGAQMPGGKDLSQLGSQIQQTVAGRIAGMRQQQPTPIASPTDTALGGLSGLGDRIRASVQRATAGTMGAPGVGTSDLGGGLGSSIMARVNAQLAQSGVGQGVPGTTPTTPGAAAPAPSGGVPPAGQGVVAGPGSGTSAPTSDSANGVAGLIVQQETGGQDLTGQTNCTIRPAAGCLALDSGIFESTANAYGLDFNRIVNDQQYANQAVATLMTGYATDDASKWNGPAGQTVWQYGEQNLPGGGWEAVARVYFGGDVTGQYVDEQGRSGATYGQQFVQKMQNAGIPTGPGTPTPGTTAAPTAAPAGGTQVLPTNPPQQIDPATGAPIQATPVTGANGGVATAPMPTDPTGAPIAGSSTAGRENVVHPPVPSGSITTLAAPDGGVMADPSSDTSYQAQMIGGGIGVATTVYKEAYPGQGDLYCYQQGHQASCDSQAAIDIGCSSPNPQTGSCYGTPVSMPGSQGGTVVCNGTGNGSGAYDSCNAYNDANGGVGNITVMLDPNPMGDQIQLRFGHMSTSAIGQVGDHIDPGQLVGAMGTFGTGPHVHFEAIGMCKATGTYVYLDPTLVVDGYYNSHPVC